MKIKDKYMYKICYRLYNFFCLNIILLFFGFYKGKKKILLIFLFNYVLNELYGIFKFFILDNKYIGF